MGFGDEVFEGLDYQVGAHFVDAVAGALGYDELAVGGAACEVGLEVYPEGLYFFGGPAGGEFEGAAMTENYQGNIGEWACFAHLGLAGEDVVEGEAFKVRG